MSIEQAAIFERVSIDGVPCTRIILTRDDATWADHLAAYDPASASSPPAADNRPPVRAALDAMIADGWEP